MVVESPNTVNRNFFNFFKKPNKKLIILILVSFLITISFWGYHFYKKFTIKEPPAPPEFPELEGVEPWVREEIKNNPSDPVTGEGMYPVGKSDQLGVIGLVEEIDLKTSILVVNAKGYLLSLHFDPWLEVLLRPNDPSKVPVSDFPRIGITELKTGDKVNTILMRKDGDLWVWGLMKIP